ncbi:MAG TPA: nitrogen regulation protein NR(II) [Desulfobacterales bacterium]
MRSETETQYLLKAIEAFRRRMIVVSPDFRILAATCHMKEIEDAALVGRHCYAVLYGRETPCSNCAVKNARQTGGPALRTKEDDVPVQENVPCLYAYPITTDDKQEAYVSMDFDLPTRGEIEEKLQRSNALLRNLILSAVDGVIAADLRGKILIFNETAAEIFGYSVEEALESLNIRNIYPERLELEVMRRLRSDEYGGRGKLRSYQVEVLHKNGDRIPINLNAAIVYEGNREAATIGFFHDLREIHQMKAELEKTQMQLLQSEKMASLGKLAAGVAHQLNNPLGGITLFTKLVLEDYELEEGVREDLGRVLRDAERCKDTVKELLEFTRQTRHLMQPHDINRAIERTLFLLENQSLFQNIEIVKELDASLPPVNSDIQQLNHMFMNIILNAAEAMEGDGRLVFKTGMVANEAWVRIEISDSGPGIPADILPQIFDPFFTTKDEGKGTGLGLSLVYGIVENHGGRIKCESPGGRGTTFIIELPLAPNEHGGTNGE